MYSSCGSHPSVPETFEKSDAPAQIYPDYVDVVVPANLAPLHFTVDTPADDYVVRLTSGDESVTYGRDALPTPKEWKRLCDAADDGNIRAEVFIAKGQTWVRLRPFVIHISSDEIDPYISYRLIAPSYVTYEGLTINQRDLTTYDETLIYSNMINSDERDGQCINCHAYQQGNPDRMQFHCRQALGGTVIAYDGELQKHKISYNLKEDAGDTVTSAGVYPAWHPTLKLIAYSSNKTGQSFHTVDLDKIEVQDSYSDLILYDVAHQRVIPQGRDTTQLDCFPAWDPAGRYLYYCSAPYAQRDTTPATTRDFDMILHYRQLHYSLYRRPFDARTLKLGAPEMVYNAMADSTSATLPRISPDGRWLLFTRGHHGVFHIWHRDADLYLLDLKTRQLRAATPLNSTDVESYHTWSSTGRWVIFSSRRADGNYTRPFIAHFDPRTGRFSRPFELPQDDPQYHRQLLRSYNVPEFMRGPVTITPQEFGDVIRKN